jgi:VanZ family protein
MRIPVPVVPAPLRWLAVVGTAGFVFYTSIVTTPPPNPVVPEPPSLVPLDKWRHFLAYGAIAGTLWYASVDWDRPAWQVALVVVGLTVLYGVGLEAWQSLVPRRYFSVGDAYANALGALFVLPLFALRDWSDLFDAPGR